MDGTGRSRGPGWRIVRSIVRLLYLVPSSFCGSLSHPFSLPAFPATRQPRVLRLPRSSCSGLTFVCRAHRLLAPTPIPVFTPPRSSLSFSHLPDLTPRSCSPTPLVLPSSSLARARIASPFLGLFPLSTTTTISIATTTISIRSHRPRSLRPNSLRARELRREEVRERRKERPTHAYARVWPR